MVTGQGKAVISNAGKPKPGLAPVLKGEPELLHICIFTFDLRLAITLVAASTLRSAAGESAQQPNRGKPFLRG